MNNDNQHKPNVELDQPCDANQSFKPPESINKLVMEWLMRRCETLENGEFYEIEESAQKSTTSLVAIDNVIQVDNANRVELNKLIERFSRSPRSNTLKITKKKKQVVEIFSLNSNKAVERDLDGQTANQRGYFNIFKFFIFCWIPFKFKN